MPLMEDEEEQVLEREESTFNSPISNFIDRLRHAYWHNDDQMEFDFPDFDEIERRRGAVWIDLRIDRLPTFTRELLPDSKWLSKCEVGGNGTDKPARWTDGLRPTDRARLAQALLLIRKEKKAMRAEDLQEEGRHNGCGER